MISPLIRLPFRFRWWCERFHWLGLPIRTTQTCTVCGAVYAAKVEPGPLRVRQTGDPLSGQLTAIEREELQRALREFEETERRR